MASSLLLFHSILMNPTYARFLYSIYLSKILLHFQDSVVLSSPLYLQGVWKIFLGWSGHSCCLEIVYSVVISFYFSGFCSYSLFQFFHYQCKNFSSQPIFWYSPSFSFSLSFFYLLANHASILIRSFLNLLISPSIRYFQKGSCFLFAVDFLMPNSSLAILIAACVTFLQCPSPVVFTYSNTFFIW